MRPVGGAVVGAAMLFIASVAHADDPRQECISASEKGQQARNAGKLSEARDQFALCGRSECPKLVEKDCTEWMKEVLAILPSVVVAVKDPKGRDLVDAKVRIDGKLAAESIDGKAILVDPGVHTFRYEAKSGEAAEEQVVVRQGEKNRLITATITSPTTKDKPAKEEPPSSGGIGAPPLVSIILAGAGLVLGGVALYIDLDANAAARNLRRTCAPACDAAAVDDIDSQYTVAGLTAGIGGAALIAGIVLWLTHSNSKTSAFQRPPIAGFRF